MSKTMKMAMVEIAVVVAMMGGAGVASEPVGTEGDGRIEVTVEMPASRYVRVVKRASARRMSARRYVEALVETL